MYTVCFFIDKKILIVFYEISCVSCIQFYIQVYSLTMSFETNYTLPMSTTNNKNILSNQCDITVCDGKLNSVSTIL